MFFFKVVSSLIMAVSPDLLLGVVRQVALVVLFSF